MYAKIESDISSSIYDGLVAYAGTMIVECGGSISTSASGESGVETGAAYCYVKAGRILGGIYATGGDCVIEAGYIDGLAETTIIDDGADSITIIGADLAGTTHASAGAIKLVGCRYDPAKVHASTDVSASVPSRSTYSGADTPGTTTLLTRVPDGLGESIDGIGSTTTELASRPSPLTAQQTADAMKLAPSAGSAAAGSVQAKLDDAGGGGSGGATAEAIWSYGTRSLTAGPSIASPAQQFGDRTIVQGDDYSSTARSFLVTITSGAEWPTDLSEYTWAISITRNAANDISGAAASITATVTVSTATGSSRAVRVNIDGSNTTSAIGAYDYEIVGTKSSEDWTIELGTLKVVKPGMV